jgi:hypothetical protein
MTMNWWTPYFIEVASTLTVAGIVALIRGVWKINQHLTTLNGRMGKAETRQIEHEKVDDERHDINSKHLDSQTKLLWELKGAKK